MRKLLDYGLLKFPVCTPSSVPFMSRVAGMYSTVDTSVPASESYVLLLEWTYAVACAELSSIH